MFDNAMIEIGRLRHEERQSWASLWRAYLDYHRASVPPERYEHTFSRLMIGTDLHGIGARYQNRLVGLAHFLFHPSTWANDVCYLQDLYVDPAFRTQGIGRQLIEAVADRARARRAGRLYWVTEQDNITARALHERVARFNGFIRYDHASVG
jgi:GNAT superfamily N-acetyltransferase